MRPRLRLAYIEVTGDWVDAITRAAGRVAAVFLYDARLRVRCCEMTPSYALHLAGYLTEHRVGDAVQAEMAAATEVGEVRYVHCWRVDGFHRARRRPGYRDIDPFLPGRMPCTLPFGVRAPDRDAAVAEALEALTRDGYTTT